MNWILCIKLVNYYEEGKGRFSGICENIVEFHTHTHTRARTHARTNTHTHARKGIVQFFNLRSLLRQMLKTVNYYKRR